MIGKVLLFSAGLLVGAGGILAAQFTQPGNNEETPQPVQRPKPGGVSSPLAVVESELSSSSAAIPAVSSDLVDALLTRMGQVEARIAELELALVNVDVPASIGAEPRPTPQVTTPENLLSAGFDSFTIEEIQTRRNQVQLERLDLRDRATREGWVNSDRFREAIQALSRDGRLRQTLGDENYEKLLLAEGRNNRVKIDSVIANSAAEVAGIKNGDVLLRYADERIFTFGDLRNATTSGNRDEPVNVRLQRFGETIDFVVPRGPLGVTVSGTIEK